MPTAVSDITAISNYAGLHYQNIVNNIYENLDIVNDLHPLRNLTSPRQLWGFDAEKGLRPIDTAVEDTNRKNGKFRKRTISPRVMMKLIKVVPEELRDTFLSENLNENDTDIPRELAPYFWDEQAKVIAEEWNENAYMGVDPESVPTYSGASTYAAGARVAFDTGDDGIQYYRNISGGTTTAGESPTSAPAKWLEVNAECLAEGHGTLIAKEITAGNLENVSVTGAITASNALDKIDGIMWDDVPEKIKAKATVTFWVSRATFRKRVQAMRALKNDGNFYTEADIKEAKGEIIDSDGKGIVRAASWLGSSERVIWTIPKNLVVGINQLPGKNPFGKFVEGLQHYRGIFKAISAYQICRLEYMGVNDQP